MSIHLVSLLIIAFTFQMPSAKAEYDPTDDLLAAFSGTCSSNSSVNDQARANAATLTAIAKNFRSDPACSGVAPSLDALSNAIDAQNRAWNQVESAKLRDKAVLQDLELALLVEKAKPAADQNIDFVTKVTTETADLRISIAKNNQQPNYQKNEAQINQVLALQTAANNVVNSVRQNGKCMNAHPNLLGQIVGGVLNAAASFFPGVLGASLFGAGTLVDNMVRLVHDQKMNGKVTNLRRPNFTEAMGCTLEGLASTYCQARDIKTVIRDFKEKEIDPTCNTGVLGARLVGQELASLLDWIRELSLVEGSPREAASAEELRRDYTGMLKGIEAQFKEAEREIQKGKDKKTILRSLIASLRSSLDYGSGKFGLGNDRTQFPLAETSFGNATFRVFNNSYYNDLDKCGILKFLYTGGKLGIQTSDDAVAGDKDYKQASIDTCLKEFRNKGSTYGDVSIENMLAATEKYKSGIGTFVQNELSTIEADDPSTVLARGETKNARRQKPMEVLRGIRDYLAATKADIDPTKPNQVYLSKSVENSLLQLDNALAAYENKDISDKEKAKQIYKAFGANDYTKFETAIFNVVKLDIERREELQKNESTQMLFELSNLGAATEMIKYLGFTDKETAGSNQAQFSSMEGLKGFTSLFHENLNESLVYMKKNAPPDVLGMMCMRVLLSPTIPSAAREVCPGTRYRGDTMGPLAFNDFYGKPPEQRVCAIYDYFRKSRLASKINYKDKRTLRETALPEKSVPNDAVPKTAEAITGSAPETRAPSSDSPKEEKCSNTQLNRGCKTSKATSKGGPATCKCSRGTNEDWRTNVFSHSGS